MSKHMNREEIILAYWEAELAEASEMLKQAIGKNAEDALFYLKKKNALTAILEEIKGEQRNAK